jgi:hypothetical protein
MAKNEKKGKGFLGKIAEAFSGNTEDQAGDNQSTVSPEPISETNDAPTDSQEVQELKDSSVPPSDPPIPDEVTVPKPKPSGAPKSFSEMLKERSDESHEKIKRQAQNKSAEENQ